MYKYVSVVTALCLSDININLPNIKNRIFVMCYKITLEDLKNNFLINILHLQNDTEQF